MPSVALSYLFSIMMPNSRVVLDPFNYVSDSSTYGRGVEISNVLISFFNPLVPGFLFPKDLLIVLHGIQLVFEFFNLGLRILVGYDIIKILYFLFDPFNVCSEAAVGVFVPMNHGFFGFLEIIVKVKDGVFRRILFLGFSYQAIIFGMIGPHELKFEGFGS